MTKEEGHSNNIAKFYLLVLIGTISSISLPNSLFMSLILLSNIATGLVISMNEDKSSQLSRISTYLLFVITAFFNIWGVYQTISFFGVSYADILIVSIFLAIFYAFTWVIINSQRTLELVKNIIPKKDVKDKIHPKDIVNSKEMRRVIGYKSRNKEVFLVKEGDGSSFEAKNTTAGEVIIIPNDNLESLLKKDPHGGFSVIVDLPTIEYEFETRVLKLDPLTISLPERFKFTRDINNARSSYRINSPKKISASISTPVKNYSLQVDNISTTGIKVGTESTALIEYMKNVEHHVSLLMYIEGEMVEVEAQVMNTESMDNGKSYGLEFMNISNKLESRLQVVIFNEIAVEN